MTKPSLNDRRTAAHHSAHPATQRRPAEPVVNDVSLEIQQGEFLVLLGPSGSGKTTLLRAIAALVGEW